MGNGGITAAQLEEATYCCRTDNINSLRHLMQYRAFMQSLQQPHVHELNVMQWPTLAEYLLFDAVQKDSVKCTEELLPHATVDMKDVSGKTHMHWAAMFDAVQCTAVLLQAGHTPNTRDNVGKTPLHIAARWNAVRVAQLLLRQPNIELSPQEGVLLRTTPRDMAVAKEHHQIVDMLDKAAQDSESLD